MKSKVMSKYGNDNLRAQEKQQQMQEKLRKVQIDMQKKAEEIESMEFSGSAGAGAVKVVVTGDKMLSYIKVIDKSLYPSEKEEELEKLLDLIVVAANNSLEKVDKVTDEEIAEITKDLPISPGLLR